MKSRRAFVIIAVLVIIGSALYVATALLFQAQADVASSHRAADIAQARALAWSGIQAAMSRLNEQRERILAGQQPRIDDEYQIYETVNTLGIVRMISMGSAGETLVPEAGKLDLNSIDKVALENTGLIAPDVAAAVIAFRQQQPGGRFQSVADLLRTSGGSITAEMLHGPLQEITTQDSASMKTRDLAERTQARLAEPQVRGLADILTVLACEPALQMTGVLRINLNVPWSEALQQRVSERFGPEAASMAKQLFDTGVRFDNESRLFQILHQYKSPPENWPPIIDAFTSEDGPFHHGRLDINTASYEALRGLPGVTPEQAAQLARVRDDLSDDERRTVAWPAIAQILPPESYDALAGHITTRCWMYRFRLAAGEVNAAEPDGELHGRVIYEVVIDLSSPTPRVAYLRDITTLQSTARMFAAAAVRSASDFAKDESTNLATADEVEPGEQSTDDRSESTSAGDRSDSPSRLQPDRHDSAARTSRGDSASSQSTSSAPAPSPEAPSLSGADRAGRWRRGD